MVTICGTLNVIFYYIFCVLYFSTVRITCALTNMVVSCSCLIMCFQSMLFRYFLKYFEMVPGFPCYYRYHYWLFFPHKLYFSCKFFAFLNLFCLFLDHKCVSSNWNVYYQTCPLLIIMDYDARFIVGNDSVSFHLFIPQRTITTCL